MAQKNKYGFVDTAGNVVIAPLEVDLITDFCEGLASFKTDNKWGVIDRNGNIVVEPKFDDVVKYCQGVASFKIGNKYGLLDKSGNQIIEPIYDYIAGTCDVIGRIAQLNKKWGWIDNSGQIIIDFSFDEVGPFHEELAAVSYNLQWGFIDTKGQWKITPQYKKAFYFSEGLAPVSIDTRKWVYINVDNEIKSPTFDSYRCLPYHNGIAFLQNPGEFRPIDINGNPVNKDKYTAISDWKDGLLKVEKSKKTAYLKPDGKLVKGRFEGGEDFCEGFAAVSISYKEAHYIKTDGKMLETPEIRVANSFSEGLATSITVENESIAINKDGKVVFSLPKGCNFLGNFHDGLAQISVKEDI